VETGPHPMTLPAIQFKRILVATDFSQFSAVAVQYAASLARRYSAKLYLLTVVETTPFYLADPSALSQAIDLAREDTLRLQSDLSKEEYVSGIQTQAVVRSGDVLEEILQVTRSENVDLIGIGTHGRIAAPSGIGRSTRISAIARARFAARSASQFKRMVARSKAHAVSNGSIGGRNLCVALGHIVGTKIHG
jgi:universal stress protein A